MGQRGRKLRPHAVAHLGGNFLFGFKVVVHGSLGKSCFVNDILQGGVGIALLGKQVRGGVKDFFYGLLRIFVARHRIHSFLQTNGL